MDSKALLDHLKSHENYRGQIEHVEVLPAQEAVWGESSIDSLCLHDTLRAFLRKQNIEALYSHQEEALSNARKGKHTVVVTPTASGKTLCYNLPVLDDLLKDKEAKALYVFPTKALSQDQRDTMEEMTPQTPVFIYDGDTADGDKAKAKESGRVIITNPDMLHRGILPNHLKWHDFFRGLKFIVIDEIHAYRGVFGTHVGHVLRRLRRICRYYGSEPCFIMCSATIGNPGDHAKTLTNLFVHVIDKSGAPRGQCHFALWNQPQQVSLVQETAWLLSKLIECKTRTIAFSRARQASERILRLTKKQLKEELSSKILSYRGGYLPQERRAIEKDLFHGLARGVVATNALELGIDVGDLEACIIAGFPGTIASTWQQAGRVGRQAEGSIVFFIAVNNPLDQYLIRHKEVFFKKSAEKALIDPDNPYMLLNHCACAAHELPIDENDQFVWNDVLWDLLQLMEEDGIVTSSGRKYYYMGDQYPAEHFSLRSSSTMNFQLRDVNRSHRLIGVIDGSKAFSEVHTGAVYMHQGKTYVVKKLDVETKSAYLSQEEVNYYTMTRRDKTTEILAVEKEKDFKGSRVVSGPLRVTTKVNGFIKKNEFSGQVIGTEKLDLPRQELETVGTWLEVADQVKQEAKEAGFHFMGSLHAVEHASVGLLPLYVMCDQNDIGGLSTVEHAQTHQATIFIHDAYHGGVGFSETAYTQIESLLEDTLEAIMNCPCDEGCPNCIHSAKCSNFNQPLDKEGAVYLLHRLLKKTYSIKINKKGKQKPADENLRRAVRRLSQNS